ncbi:hypothetical protein [Bacillus sp. Marseille-P3661]|uniref:hypothetical protein n=1 Tax=Bacillus sp. Marseille-P3661 TaxID=1936234 RepID=UPI0011592B24|nr:hypothetical protein [Bacillus sp. Marseille-P3661]
MSMLKSEEINAQIEKFITELESLDEHEQAIILDENLQRLFSAIVPIYAKRVQKLFQDEDVQQLVPSPFKKNGKVTSTDVVITVSTMLKAFDIAAFEVAWFSDSEQWELKDNDHTKFDR